MMATATINARGLGGFVSDIRVREEQSYIANAPDVPVEDGTYIQDHIIPEPEQIAISGQISGVHISHQSQVFPADTSSKSDTIGALLPTNTDFQLQQLRNKVAKAVGIIDNYSTGFKNIFDSLNDNGDHFSASPDHLMQHFRDFIVGIIKKKVLIDIEMPFEAHRDMAILSFIVKTDNKSNSLEYELTAKKIVIAKSKFTIGAFSIGNPPTANKMASPVSDGIKEVTALRLANPTSQLTSISDTLIQQP